MYRIKTMNKISPLGIELFSGGKYEVGADVLQPDAILVRSADLHKVELPPSVLAIARAGAGVNNIPLAACSERGIVVFNTPGGNANAVKELTIAALLLSSRNILGGWNWAGTLGEKDDSISERVEKEKSSFEGPELKGKTLGVVGLGAIGVMVANDAVALGMNVAGYDPYISVEAAWNLSRSVERADTLEELLARSDYITLHLPLGDGTRGLIDKAKLALLKPSSRLVNLSRGALVQESAVIEALEAGKLARYITDFPSAALLACKNAVCIPHLGASTPEAEDNCAIMAVRQLIDFLETGTVRNSVNFPKCKLEFRSPCRLLVANRNIPNMVGQITTILAGGAINITDLINHHLGEYAYNIIDTEQPIPANLVEEIKSIDGIVRVRELSAGAVRR
ncbi:MAG: phosphoglycerate dehydrogenase [Treponema sp.]|jgi:D-3-phosphoglycerate dehydrogenase|nr:phosphoglycerate dehydrogenase [Treponema sp.]